MLPSPGAKTNLPLKLDGSEGCPPEGIGVNAEGGMAVGAGPDATGGGVLTGADAEEEGPLPQPAKASTNIKGITKNFILIVVLSVMALY